jgi:hypothetical protein
MMDHIATTAARRAQRRPDAPDGGPTRPTPDDAPDALYGRSALRPYG